MESNYSLSDLKAVTDNNGTFGGNGGIWLILLFLFFGFMNGNCWFFGNNRKDCASTEDVQNQFNFSALERQNNEIIAAVKDNAQSVIGATKDVAYNNLSQIRDVQADLMSIGSRLDSCCCNLHSAIDSVKFENAQNTCAITNAIHAEGETTRALIQENTMQALRDKIVAKDQELQTVNFQLSQQAQSASLIEALRPCAKPAYITCSPYFAQNAYGYGFGCGCGNFA